MGTDLFRFRTIDCWNIDAFRSNMINGTLVNKMKDPNEMLACIDRNKLLKDIKITPGELERIVRNMQAHCINNYYIACFTKDSPYQNIKMWDTYADKGNGFCLVYNRLNIVNTYRIIDHINRQYIHQLRECTYGNEKIDISKYVNDEHVI